MESEPFEVASCWERFRSMILIPAGGVRYTRHDMRAAFTCGAHAALIAARHLSPDHLARLEREAVAWLEEQTRG